MRRASFVLWNPTVEDILFFRNEVPKNPQFRYLVFQAEKGSEEDQAKAEQKKEDGKDLPVPKSALEFLEKFQSNLPKEEIKLIPINGDQIPKFHLQGYLEITKNQRFSWFKNLHGKAHWECAKGTSEQNIHYCTKPLPGCKCKHCKSAEPPLIKPFTAGQPAETLVGGEFWDSILMMVEEGKENYDIMKEIPQAAGNLRQIDAIRYEIEESKVRNMEVEFPWKDNRKIRVIWLYGDSGAGKTSSIWKMFPGIYTCSVQHSFDQYQGQKAILFDDFGKLDMNFMLRTFDIFPQPLACRYSNKWARWNEIFITSNDSPFDLYTNDALFRRITVVKATRNGNNQKFNVQWRAPLDGIVDKKKLNKIHQVISDLQTFLINEEEISSEIFTDFGKLMESIPYREFILK